MRRLRIPVLLAGLLVLGGCFDRSPEQASRSPRLPATVVLHARAAEPPAQWDRVLFVPFGRKPGEVGAITARSRGAPAFPSSFAVEADGSIWILDTVKHRLAHFAPNGRYLGSVRGGLRLDFAHPQPMDMALLGARLYVLEELMLVPSVRELRAGTPARVTSLTREGVSPVVWEFLPNQPSLTAVTHGMWAGELGSGEPGVARFEIPGEGTMHPLPGVPVQDGWMSVCGVGHAAIQTTYVAKDGTRTVRTIEIALVPRRTGAPTPTGLALANQIPTEKGLGLFLFLSSDFLDRPNIGGRWYLEISPEGSVVSWERAGEGTIRDDTTQRRYITVAPDGRVYLMIAHAEGIEILRRP